MFFLKSVVDGLDEVNSFCINFSAANAVTGGGGIMQYNMPRGKGIPLANNVTITNYYTNRDARTGASNFINFVRFSRN